MERFRIEMRRVNINVGDKVNKWTILQVIDYQHIECQCECGYIRTTSLHIIQHTSRCKSCYMREKQETDAYTLIPIIGTQYGLWEIINDRIKRGTNKVILWQVRCTGCQKEFWRTATSISTNRSNGCSRCANTARITFEGDIPNAFLNRLRSEAKKRSLDMDVDMIYLNQLFVDQNQRCKYTNLPIKFSKACFDSYQGRRERTASLDRIDSLKGYIKGNLQWIHSDINIMKNSLSEEKFLYYCHLISINYTNPESFKDLDCTTIMQRNNNHKNK